MVDGFDASVFGVSHLMVDHPASADVATAEKLVLGQGEEALLKGRARYA
jgi:hypothetical protein